MKRISKENIEDIKKQETVAHKEIKKTAKKSTIEAKKLIKILKENHITVVLYKAIGGNNGH
jgi:hypothetical protein